MRSLKFHVRLWLLPLMALAVFPSLSYAQFYFGKNKVQYTDFDWHEMRTEHFRVFFYVEEETVAKIAARIAEDSYRVLASRFRQEVYTPIPLIIYSSPNYFSQTNVTPELLPEAVGGFTEFLKGRVVLPFHGSYFEFEHVLRHELVHVFTFAKLESVMTKQKYLRMAPPPLWFTEGIAEYWSIGWDSEADMVLKDMVLAGRLIPISRMYEVEGTFFMYKLGQSICRFINDTYGRDKLTLLFENWWKGENFEQIVKLTIGKSMEEISDDWEYYLKKNYYPQIADNGLADMDARQLTHSGYSMAGVPVSLKSGSDSGDWIIFMANKMGYTGLYMMPPEGDRSKVYTLLKGESSASFESLHLLQSGIDANDSGMVLFSSKSEGHDVLYLYDIFKRGVIKEFEFAEMATITSPRFSPDDKNAVFSGADKSGVTDIYILKLEDGRLTKLTSDFYYDVNPAFNLRGDSIVFSSDRCLDGDSGAINLYEMPASGGAPQQLTSGRWKDLSASVEADGVYYSSDRDGNANIYRLNPDGTSTKMTSLLTGAYDPRITPDKKNIIFSGYQNLGYHIYETPKKDSLVLAASKTVSGETFWRPGILNLESVKSSVKYRTSYTFDIAQSAISYDPVYGSIGGLQVALSDMLGDNVFYFLLTNTAESRKDFLSSFNIAVTYINQKRRLNWGIGIYHLYDEYFNDFDGYYFERQVGGLLHLNYPLSKFNRVEATTYLRYSDKDKFVFGERRRAALSSSYLSFISDNSLWDISGPLEGHRYNFTIGITEAVDRGRLFNRLELVDIRNYFRLGKYSAFASRLFAFNSSGVEPQRIYFGGSWSFRGYSRQAFYNRNILFASHELRFPLLDNLLLGFPFGGINFQAIRGALFFDTGSAWDDHFDRFLGSFGTGFRVALGQLIVLRFDFTRTTDFRTVSPRTAFDFFFGWNF